MTDINLLNNNNNNNNNNWIILVVVWRGKGVVYLMSPERPTVLAYRQGLLSLQQIRVKGTCFLFLLFLCCHSFSFLPRPSLLSHLLSLLSFFSFSLGEDTK